MSESASGSDDVPNCEEPSTFTCGTSVFDTNTTMWCENCETLRVELDKVQAEHALNYSTLKEKIVSTDKLIKTYSAKCQEYDTQTRQLDEVKRKLTLATSNCGRLENQLKTALLEVEPLKMMKQKLERTNRNLEAQLQVAKDRLEGAESSYKQFLLSERQTESAKEKLEEKLHVANQKIQDFETSMKRQEAVLKRTQDELKQKKADLTQERKENKSLVAQASKLRAETLNYYSLLVKHGLLKDAKTKPPQSHWDAPPRPIKPDPQMMQPVAMATGGTCTTKHVSYMHQGETSHFENRLTTAGYLLPETSLVTRVLAGLSTQDQDSDTDEDELYLFGQLGSCGTVSPRLSPVSPLPPSPAPALDDEDSDTIDEYADLLEMKLLTANPTKASPRQIMPAPQRQRGRPPKNKNSLQRQSARKERHSLIDKIFKRGGTLTSFNNKPTDLDTNIKAIVKRGGCKIQESLSDSDGEQEDSPLPFQDFTSDHQNTSNNNRETATIPHSIVKDLEISSDSDMDSECGEDKSIHNGKSTEDIPRRITRSQSQLSLKGSPETQQDLCNTVKGQRSPGRSRGRTQSGSSDSGFKEPSLAPRLRLRSHSPKGSDLKTRHRRHSTCTMVHKTPVPSGDESFKRITRSNSCPGYVAVVNKKGIKKDTEKSHQNEMSNLQQSISSGHCLRSRNKISSEGLPYDNLSEFDQFSCDSRNSPHKMLQELRDISGQGIGESQEFCVSMDSGSDRCPELAEHCDRDPGSQNEVSRSKNDLGEPVTLIEDDKLSPKHIMGSSRKLSSCDSVEHPNDSPGLKTKADKVIPKNNTESKNLYEEDTNLKHTPCGHATKPVLLNETVKDEKPSHSELPLGGRVQVTQKEQRDQNENEDGLDESENQSEPHGGEIGDKRDDVATEEGSSNCDIENTHKLTDCEFSDLDIAHDFKHSHDISVNRTNTEPFETDKSVESAEGGTFYDTKFSQKKLPVTAAEENISEIEVLPNLMDKVWTVVEESAGVGVDLPKKEKDVPYGENVDGTLPRAQSVDGDSLEKEPFLTDENFADNSTSGAGEQDQHSSLTGSKASRDLMCQNTEEENTSKVLNEICKDTVEGRRLSTDSKGNVVRPTSLQTKPSISSQLNMVSTSLVYIPSPGTVFSQPPAIIRARQSAVVVVSPETSGIPITGSVTSRSGSPSVHSGPTPSLSEASSPLSLPPSLAGESENAGPLSPLPSSPTYSEPLSPLSISPTEELTQPVSPLPPSPQRPLVAKATASPSIDNGAASVERDSSALPAVPSAPSSGFPATPITAAVISPLSKTPGDSSPSVESPVAKFHSEAPEGALTVKPQQARAQQTEAPQEAVSDKRELAYSRRSLKREFNVCSLGSVSGDVESADVSHTETDALEQSSSHVQKTEVQAGTAQRPTGQGCKRKSSKEDPSLPPPPSKKMQPLNTGLGEETTTVPRASKRSVIAQVKNIDRELQYLVRLPTMTPAVVAERIEKLQPPVTTSLVVTRVTQAAYGLDLNLLPIMYTACCGTDQIEPFLPEPEAKLLQILILLDQTFLTGLVEEMLRTSHKVIVEKTSATVLAQLSLCRIFTGLCRQKGLSERALVLIYDIMCQQAAGFASLVLVMVGVWPQLLTKHPDNRSQPLTEILEYILMKKTLQVKVKHGKMVQCFSRLCGWTVPQTSGVQVAETLMQQVKALTGTEAQSQGQETDDCFEILKSLELLSVAEGWEWTNNYLIRQLLWPILQEWSTSKQHTEATARSVLCLLGMVCSHCPLSHFTAVVEVMRVLSALLFKAKEAEVPLGVQCTAMDSLLLLAPYNPDLAATTAQQWRRLQGDLVPQHMQVKVTKVLDALRDKLPYLSHTSTR